MEHDILQQAEKYTRKHRRYQTWKKVVGALACVVVFCTTYALILPAITMERQTICGKEEHIHTEECYTTELRYPQSSMNCTLDSGGAPVIHTHDENCYSEDGTLICALPELEAHRHTSRCYREEQRLVCTEEEDLGHEHSGSCYTRHRGELTCTEEEDEGHTHDDGCYDVDRELTCDDDGEDHEHNDSCYTETRTLTCTEEERPGHTHGDSCYEWTEELTCTEEERPAGHIHTEECYEVTTKLDCGQEEVIPHTHSEDCYDESGALACGMEEVLEHQHTEECIVPAEGEPWEVQVLTCGQEEHTHTEDCYPPPEEEPLPGGEETSGGGAEVPVEEVPAEEVPAEEIPLEPEKYVCGQEEHTHAEDCYDPEGNLTCGQEEHTHGESCLAAVLPEMDEAVQAVIDLIDALPACGEVEAALTAYEEAEDWESYEGYFLSVERQARYAYEQYTALTEDQQAQVTNADKLLELEWIWSAATLDLPTDAKKVTSQSELNAALKDGAYVALSADFSAAGVTIPSGTVTLDLNGHALMASGTLFTVPSGASLTIVDSQQGAETVETATGDLFGRTASLSGSTLTYYVTRTEITNDDTGATEETLEKHTVTAAGSIVGGSQPVFSVTGGTLAIQSGMIRSGTGRAIDQTGGATVFQGGYICGFSQTSNNNAAVGYFGGAVRVNGGTLKLAGGVLAGNTAPNGGGIYAAGSAEITITGGVISGNTANRKTSNWENHSESGTYRCGGGGIYAGENAVITMSGGYITNNVAADTGYFDGGGGVCLSGTSAMALSGGYVTGNKAQGGGGIRTDFGKETEFVMEGGFISANVATTAEGGGVTIDRNGVGTVTGGYVTNNRIINTVHWGGGGLFCADGSTLNLKNALITDNTAGGFGGGVAGCPTGKLYLYITQGCAIYDNMDTVDSDSPHYVNGGAKNDIDITRCTEVFQSNGHADYFCALNSTVTGTMLGGNAANWQGSADYQPVIADAEDLLSATQVMGLQSHPTEEGKRAAEAVAKVYVNGNYSYTHGGGILCNGNLVIGVPVDIEVPARVELQATKKLVNQGDLPVSMEGNDFSFLVTMTEVDGTVIANGICDASGTISFDHQLTFKQVGTFVYYVYEEANGNDPLVTYDPTLYRLTMTVTKDNGVAWYGDTIKYTYSVTSIKVEKSTDGGTAWTQVSNDTTSQSGVITLPLTDGTTFTNRVTEVTKLTVRKEWEGGPGADSVTVILKKDGEEYQRTTLNADNEWTYTWTGLETGHSYTVEEEAVPGYIASYKLTTDTEDSGQTSLGQGSWWVPATELTAGQKYLIVSPDGTKALKVASGGEGDGFNTADVTTVEQQQTAITVKGQTYATWYQSADISGRSIYVAESFTRNGKSGIFLKRSDGGSYPYLRLESNNNNYLKGASTTTYASFMVFDGIYLRGHNAAEWTPDALRTLIYENNKFNSTTDQTPASAVKLYTLVSGEAFGSAGTGSSTVVITNTRDETGEYVLPETGGPGTTLYTMGGLCLMAGALLLYSLQTRRKGGRDGPC